MEEELNEEELEERLYAMIHYVDDTQQTEQTSTNSDAPSAKNPAAAQSSTLRRYWRSSTDQTPANTQFQKVNKLKPLYNPLHTSSNKTKPKQENVEVKPKCNPEPVKELDLNIFHTCIPADTKISVEILENEVKPNVVELESSDEDEVVEVALPPKPTITIESSDEDDTQIIPDTPKQDKEEQKKIKEKQQINKNSEVDREISASPVPSVVSSVSDDFIRGDCIALNISSRRPADHSFDFSLHGSDLLDNSTPSRKKKKKKNKESNTPAVTTSAAPLTPEKPGASTPETCFATPKSKTKNKKQKHFKVIEKSIPNPDVYDSDSNQSIETSKITSYAVTEKSCPSADTYESDTSHSEMAKDCSETPVATDKTTEEESPIQNADQPEPEVYKGPYIGHNKKKTNSTSSLVDLTQEMSPVEDDLPVENNIIMANVTGFNESDDNDIDPNEQTTTDPSQVGSTKLPAILYENMDFDFLKGNNDTVPKRRYSLKSLRADMEKFYNESWGGENFNHRDIQKTMSRDKSLWEIDAKDRMPTPLKWKPTCHYCKRVGHREDTCRVKPAVCHMCGVTGHYETRCPNKICVNCGSPNYMYSTVCRNCSSWSRLQCAECLQYGHPPTHCPDLWRRYHNTVDNNSELEATVPKRYNQLYCSGCSRRGHLVHSCRVSLPFSGLPVYSPYVARYQPIHPPSPDRPYRQTERTQEVQRKGDKNKRQSKSPTCHETHVNKKKMLEEPKERRNSSRSIEEYKERRNSKSTIEEYKARCNWNRSVSESKLDNIPTPPRAVTPKSPKLDGHRNRSNSKTEKDELVNSTNNRDKNGQLIQENEVSDTSDTMSMARIFVTNDILDKLKTDDGEEWMNEKMQEHNVIVNNSNVQSYLNILGLSQDQEAFQSDLRDWINNMRSKDQGNNTPQTPKSAGDVERAETPASAVVNIPKNRNNAIRQLNKAFESLKEYHGDPKIMFKELNYLQNCRQQLLKQKIVSPKQLSNNRDYIKGILKKLNMVLLGQAGLADGSKHLSELQAIQEKLVTYRQKLIPLELRKEICAHYKCIFAAIPRDDYEELIQKFYTKRNDKPIKKKKTPKVIDKKVFNPLSAANNHDNNPNVTPKAGQGFSVMKSTISAGVLESIRRQVDVCYSQLLSLRPVQNKKMKQQLARRLHTNMAVLNKRAAGKISSKQLKKMRRLTEQAQLFLSSNK